jgi:uncharacterized phage protein (TIGR02220 family)
VSRYKRIEVMMWGDEKFRSLSPIPPCAAGLWVYLLTGPHNGIIPGLFATGERALAEALSWPLYSGEPGALFDDHPCGFRECWREIAAQKMAFADWKARIVYVPRALMHNKPKSPNVVVGWRHSLAELPECALKHRAIAELRAGLDLFGPSFVAAFDRAMRDGASKVGEADEDEDDPNEPDHAAEGAANALTVHHTQVVKEVVAYLNERAGTKFIPTAKSTRRLIVARIAEGRTVDDMKRVIDKKCAEWLTCDKMRPFLRPATLFNAEKFESYINGHEGSGRESDVFSRNRAAMKGALS